MQFQRTNFRISIVIKASVRNFVPMLRTGLLFLFGLMSGHMATAQNTDTTTIDRFAFGSCAFHFGKQKIWNSVIKNDPQLWVAGRQHLFRDPRCT